MLFRLCVDFVLLLDQILHCIPAPHEYGAYSILYSVTIHERDVINTAGKKSTNKTNNVTSKTLGGPWTRNSEGPPNQCWFFWVHFVPPPRTLGHCPLYPSLATPLNKTKKPT